MRAHIVVTSVGLAAIASGVATAAPVDSPNFSPPSITTSGLDSITSGLTSNAGPRSPNPNPLDYPSVTRDETVSISLQYWAAPAMSSTGPFNSGGDVSVLINGPEVSLGTSPQGDEILGQVTEAFAGDERRVITVTYRTENLAPLLRPGTQVGGEDALLLSWHIGTTDAVEWGQWMTDVDLLGANQGALFRGYFDTATNPDPSPDFVDHTGAFQAPGPDGQSVFSLEDGLTDFGVPLVDSNAFGFNRISVSYTFDVIPAPATAALVGVGSLVLRRRRR